jgi:hypothetical protein
MSQNAVQVEPEHYAWGVYTDKSRWASYWHQIDEVLAVSPGTCVEVGVGSGEVPTTLRANGVRVTTVDIDERLGVDRRGSVTALPCADDEFDVALCAQVLEHLPWDQVPGALRELARVAKNRVVISLPQSGRTIRLLVTIPVIGHFDWIDRTPGIGPHPFDGEHYWQVGAKHHRRKDVRALMEPLFHIGSEYTVPENPYHRFYVLTPKEQRQGGRFARSGARSVSAPSRHRP